MSIAVVVDDTALLALGAGHQVMSRLVTAATAHPDRYVYAPAMCVAAAVAGRSQLGSHLGALEAITVLDLGFADAEVAGVAIAAGIEWGQAHALAAARPTAEWPGGLPVVTGRPEPLRRHGIQVVALR